MALTRRSLLSRGAMLIAAGLTAPSFVARTAWALDPATAAEQNLGAPNPALTNKILVVIQLSGGNDGLNMVVPFADPAYARLRPSLGLKPEEVLKLNDAIGLHPQMGRLKGLYDQGKVAVIQGVGYPNPDRSHFRSMDIWHSARPDVFERSGWLGRYLEACQCSQEGVMPALSVGDQLNNAFWTQTTLIPALSNVGAYTFQTDARYRSDRANQLATLQNIYSQAGAFPQFESLIRQGTLAALSGADELQKVAEAYKTPIQYPANNGLASQLKMVAQVMSGNLGARVYSVTQGGFDTHANEKDPHANLMKQYSEAVDAFVQDLANIGKQDDVLMLTFSEFGRRPKQNGSGGTDHGTAAPMFLLGNGVQGGVYGTQPSLSDLDRQGDLKFKADFRSVYAGVLKDHLGADATQVLGGTFSPVAAIKTRVA